MATSSNRRIPLETEEDVQLLASRILGVSRRQLVGFFHPAYVRGDAGAIYTAFTTATRTGGIQKLTLSTGATANSLSLLTPAANSALAPWLFPVGAAKRWVAMARFALPSTTFAAGDYAGLLLRNPTSGGGLFGVIGVRHDTSATNFVAWADNGSAIDSGVAKDTADHVHAFAKLGATTQYLIDEVIRGTPGALNPTVDSTPGCGVNQPTNAVNRDLAVRWWAGYAVAE